MEVDLKVTSTKRPQSSSPFRDATQKVYGLGYHLLVLIYSKEDDNELGKAWVTFHHAIFVDRNRTADSRTTPGLREILDRNGSKDEVLDFFEERNLPLDASGREALADRIFNETPELGQLTIINALQWR